MEQARSAAGVGAQGIKWKFALPESNVRSRTQGEQACFAGIKVSPTFSVPSLGHGEGATQHSCKREADDTNPIRFETNAFFPVKQESTQRGHQKEALGTVSAALKAATLKDDVICAQ